MDLSAGSLFASLLVSTVGLGLFLYGKKATRIPQLVVGLALMGFPYFVSGALAMCGIGAALVGALFVALRMGL